MALRSELIAAIGMKTSGFKKAAGSLKGILVAGVAAAAAAAAAVIAGAVIFKNLVLGAAKAGDELDKLSRKTGISVEELQRLKHAAELSGSGIESLEKGVKRMASFLDDVDNGLAEAVRSMDRLGVSMSDVKGKTPTQQLQRLLEALAGVEDFSTRSALAQDVFGRAGTDLLPILTNGAAGLREMREEMDRLGIITTEQATQAADFQDAWLRVTTAFTQFKTSAGIAFLPTLEKELNSLLDTMIELRDSGAMEDFATDAVSALKDAIVVTKELLTASRELLSLAVAARRLDEETAKTGATGKITESTLLKESLLNAPFVRLFNRAVKDEEVLSLEAAPLPPEFDRGIGDVLGPTSVEIAKAEALAKKDETKKKAAEDAAALAAKALSDAAKAAKAAADKQAEAAKAQKEAAEKQKAAGEVNLKARNEIQNAIKALNADFDRALNAREGLRDQVDSLIRKFGIDAVRRVEQDRLGAKPVDIIRAMEEANKRFGPGAFGDAFAAVSKAAVKATDVGTPGGLTQMTVAGAFDDVKAIRAKVDKMAGLTGN